MITLNPREQLVLDALREAADAGEPCPSNTQLAQLIDACGTSLPSTLISRLEHAGHFTVQRAHNGRRVHFADGASTAPLQISTWQNRSRPRERVPVASEAPPIHGRGVPCQACGCRADACQCKSPAFFRAPQSADSVRVGI